MTTREVSELRAELDRILREMAAVNPSLITIDEWRSFKTRVRDVELRLAQLETNEFAGEE